MIYLYRKSDFPFLERILDYFENSKLFNTVTF